MMTVTWQVGLMSKKTLLAGESTKDQAEPVRAIMIKNKMNTFRTIIIENMNTLRMLRHAS